MIKTVSKSYKTAVTLLLCLFAAGVVFQSCSKDDGDFRVDAFGPSMVNRCGEISFRGNKLDQVERIYLPADDYGWIIEKADFVSQSSGEIRLNVPCDYPLDQKGQVIVIYSGGKEWITMSSFMVQNIAGAQLVIVDGEIYQGEPLDPGTLITIQGNVLLAVDSLLFGDGLGIRAVDFVEWNDQYITFRLPDNVPTGSLIQLKVPARNESMIDVYLDICEIFLVGPSITGFVPNGGNGVFYCGKLEILVNRIDRVQVDEDGNTPLTIGTVETKGRVDVAGGKILVDMPTTLSFSAEEEPYSVILYSVGKPYLSEGKSFTIAKPTFDHRIESAGGNNYYIYVTGDLCSLKTLRFTNRLGNEVNGGSKTAIDGGWRFALANLDTSSAKMTLVFDSDDEIEFDINY